MTSPPAVGDPVAPFTATTADGPFRLADHAGQTVVLYFYPKDNTPGCTNEAAEFRDLHGQFVKAGAVIYGVSRDSVKSHAGFKDKLGLPLELLSDPDETLCEAFGVMKMKNMYGKQVRGIERSTFVIDKNGYLRKEWRGVKVPEHAQAVLDFVKTL